MATIQKEPTPKQALAVLDGAIAGLNLDRATTLFYIRCTQIIAEALPDDTAPAPGEPQKETN